MRKILLLLAISACSFVNIQAQQWYTAASITGQRSGALGFAIGGYGYCGMGGNYSNYFDLWRYDPPSDSWAQVAAPPNGPRGGAFSFVVDSFAYVGLGNNSTDCWKYNGYLNQWSSIDSFPSAPRNFPACFAIGNFGYVGTGSNSRDFWRYDVANDNWMQIDSLPGVGRCSPSSFAINGTGYVGLGGDGSWTAYSDFWKYDTAIIAWVALNPFPGASREGSTALSLLGKGYLCAGGGPFWTFYDELWEYNPAWDYWQPLTPLPAYARKWMTGFVVDSTAFFGTGCMYGFDPPTYFFNDFYKFSFSILMDAGHEREMNLNVSVVGESFINIIASTELNGTVYLYSMNGEEISRQKILGKSCQLPISELANGVYLVTVETSMQRITRKVLLH